MINDELKMLVESLALSPSASEEAIDALVSEVKFSLPEEYLDLLRLSNGAEGKLGISPLSFIIIWPAEEVVLANREYGINEESPELLVFGKDAATGAFAFDTRFFPMPVIEADFIDFDYKKRVANDFMHFLRVMSSLEENL
jgi:hypothetical protein